MESIDSHDSTSAKKKHVLVNKEHELNSDGHINSNSDSVSRAHDGAIPQLSGKYDALRQNKSLVIKQTEIIGNAYKKWYFQAILLLVLLCVVTVMG